MIAALRRRGFTVIGPTIRQRAIVYEEITAASDLPAGWTEHQDGGVYRLERREDDARFGFAVGPHSWKRYLHPPVLSLWRARKTEDGSFEVREETEEPPPYAFFGARSCDLHAIRSLDRVMIGGDHPDPHYRARREAAFIVAINCGTAGGTCFCVSMDTGPKATFGFDLALTEVMDSDRHYFTVEVGSERGEEVLADVAHAPAEAGEEEAAAEVVQRTAASMGRELETDGLKELLYRNFEHPRWDEVADRCLTCGNCTMVCPTCFCNSVEDTTDLAGETTERVRKWDSCFTTDFTYVHGGSVRPTNRSRYRQWMTHKLATWRDQFPDTTGCVGCGRCITWCPVAIDITEEAAAIRATDGETP